MVLPVSDLEFLTEKGYPYETQAWGKSHLLIIHEYQLPPEYTPRVVDLMIEIPAGYPVNKLDMFWVHPEVRLTSTNNYPAAANHFEERGGRRWQRFSRHYDWRPGVDSVASHLKAIQKDLMQGR